MKRHKHNFNGWNYIHSFTFTGKCLGVLYIPQFQEALIAISITESHSHQVSKQIAHPIKDKTKIMESPPSFR